MRRILFASLIVLGLAAAGRADVVWPDNQNANGKKLTNLPAPTVGTAAVRLQDVAVGACIPKWSGVNGTASCAAGGTDFENPLTFTAPLSRSTNTISITSNGISNALIRQSAALSVVGNPTGSTANVQDIACSADNQFVGRTSGALSCQTIPGSAVTLAAGAFGFGSASNKLTGDSANAFWDASNLRAGFRTNAPGFQLHLVDQAAAADRGLMIGTHAAGVPGGQDVMRRSNGTFASPTVITTGQGLGMRAWEAYSGTQWIRTAGINATVNGTVTSSNIPTEMFFQITSAGISADPQGSQAAVPLRLTSSAALVGAQAGISLTAYNAGTLTVNGTQTITRYSPLPSASAYLDYSRARGSVTSPSAIQQDDTVGGQRFWGWDGSAWIPGLALLVNSDAAPSAGSVPMSLSLVPTKVGSFGDYGGLHVSSDRDVVIGRWAGMTTTSSAGFVWLPQVAGPPTVAPTTPITPNFATTNLATEIDSSDDRLYVYNAGWKPYGQSMVGKGDGYVKNTSATGIETTTPTIPYVDISGAPAAITALTGDVTATGPGSVAATIANDAVTYAKMQNVSAASRLIGRGSSAGAGDPQEITIGSGLSLSGTTLSATGGGTITDVTASLPLTSSGGATPNIALNYDNVTITLDVSNEIQVANDSITNAKLRNSGALSVVGRSANSSGDPGDISAVAGSDCVFREGGSTLACGTVATAGIANSAVTLGKIQNISTDVLLGRDTASTGAVEQISLSTGLTFTGSQSIRIADTAVTPGSYTYSTITVDQQGRLTAASSGAAPEVPLTFSTGLTRTSNTITANLSTGVSGGQSVVGGTAASDSLTLSSTTNGTKGRILNGSWFALDEVNQRVLVGTQTAGSGAPLTVATAGASSVGMSFTRAGDQTIEKQGSGDFYVGTLGAQALGLYTNNVTRLLIASGGGVTLSSLAGTGTRIVSASSTGLLGIATSSDVAAAITWQAAGRALISSGPTTAPTGDANFTYDTATHSAAIGTSLAVNGAAPPSNVAFISGHTSDTNRDHVQFFLAGGSQQDSPDNALFEVFAAATTIPAGRTTGVWAAERIDQWALTGSSSPTITEAASLYIANAPSIASATGAKYAIHAAAGTVAIGDLAGGSTTSRMVQADAVKGALSVVSAPMTLSFAYGGGSYDVALPSGSLGHAPDFWMRPMTYSTGGTVEGFAANGQVWEYPIPDAFTSVDLFIRVYQCSITSSSGDNDLTYVVTKNGVDTGLSIKDECPDPGGTNDTSFDDSDSVTVNPGDRVGVRAHVTDTGAYSSGALRATVTLRLR